MDDSSSEKAKAPADALEATTSSELSDIDELSLGERVGPYLIVDSIDRGGMGQVFLGNDVRLHRKVALKTLFSSRQGGTDLRARIVREARAAAQINHQNVATIHDIVDHETRTLIVMEYVEGEKLSTLIHRERLPIERVVGIGRQLAAALVAAHAKGVIHRDLKPSNIKLTTDGTVKVLDFGVAAATERFTTVSGTGVEEPDSPQPGTRGYMSPEQMLNRQVDERSDIFSLGIVLFELATGTRAYSSTDPADLHKAVLRPVPRADDVDPLIPRELADVIAGALAIDPDRRFQTVAEFGTALEGFEKSRAVKALPVPVPRRWPLGRPATVALAVGLATLAVAGSVWWRQARIVASSVAVLPFEAPGLTDAGYLVAGLSSDLARELQQFDLEVKRVVQPTSLNAALTTALGVDVLVMGTVERAGSTTTLRLRLRPSAGDKDWTRDYVEAEGSLPTLPRRVAADIAEVLGLTRRANARRPSHQANDQAWNAYLRGRALLEQRTQISLRQSIESFKRAADLDPAYAEPWSGLADAYLALGVPAFGALSPIEARSLAREAALTALKKEPNSAEAHTSLAWATFFQDWDFPAAEERFKKAIDLNPQYALAHQWYADYLNSMGRQDEAWREINLALQLEPLSLIINRDIAWHLFFQRKYSEAETQLRATLRMDPEYGAARTLLARTLAALHRYPEALKELGRPLPGTPASTLSFIGYVQAASGDRAAAIGTLRELRGMAAEEPPEYVSPYYLALIETALGRREPALQELERGFKEQDSTMVNLMVDPRLDSIRDDPRFKALVARMKFPERPR